MIGCEDENAPETWVKKLGDPIQRPAAIKRLDPVLRRRDDAAPTRIETIPNVKALLDKIIEPLPKTYVEGQLDDRTRVEVIKFLADTRDARAKAALIKACSGFAAGQGRDRRRRPLGGARDRCD